MILPALAWAPRVAAAGETVHPVPLQKGDCAAVTGDTAFTGHVLFSYRSTRFGLYCCDDESICAATYGRAAQFNARFEFDLP